MLTRIARLRRVVAHCARRFAGTGVHPGLEIAPTLPGGLNLRPRQLPGRLRERVQEDDQTARASIQNPVVVGAHVTAQLSHLPFGLRAVGKRQMRHRVGEIVEAVDLAQEAARRLASKPSMNSRTGSLPSAAR